ncbi:hypothetical protein, partial [Candidatus Villigracilis affinis]|uniref:hypothetical protein n=1 Tax=Candidatus Villigracilis affinis TaxID=3140682 RepID=UPI0031EE742C
FTQLLYLFLRPTERQQSGLIQAPYCIFAQYPRGGLTTPNRLQRFSMALSLTSRMRRWLSLVHSRLREANPRDRSQTAAAMGYGRISNRSRVWGHAMR